MNYWPLLDIKQAIHDADQALADVVRYVEQLQAESVGDYPPDGAGLLANVAAIRLVMGGMIPPRLQQEIDKEQAMYNEEDAQYSY